MTEKKKWMLLTENNLTKLILPFLFNGSYHFFLFVLNYSYNVTQCFSSKHVGSWPFSSKTSDQ